MGGLALCSLNELSFDMRGFLAAMATNLTEWLVESLELAISSNLFPAKNETFGYSIFSAFRTSIQRCSLVEIVIVIRK